MYFLQIKHFDDLSTLAGKPKLKRKLARERINFLSIFQARGQQFNCDQQNKIRKFIFFSLSRKKLRDILRKFRDLNERFLKTGIFFP